MTTIKFKKVKNMLDGFDYEAYGEFRKNVTMIRVARSSFSKEWSLIIFKDHEPRGEKVCNCVSLKDAKETANFYYAQ